jgi:hypothetical protein
LWQVDDYWGGLSRPVSSRQNPDVDVSNFAKWQGRAEHVHRVE